MLLGVVHHLADAAHFVAGESLLHGAQERHRVRVGHDHAAPAEGLHRVPVAARGEEPRGQRQDEGELAAHVGGEETRGGAEFKRFVAGRSGARKGFNAAPSNVAAYDLPPA